MRLEGTGSVHVGRRIQVIHGSGGRMEGGKPDLGQRVGAFLVLHCAD